MPAKNTGNLEKWEHPKKSGIWIREILYTQTFNGKEGTYSAYQITVPAKLTGSVRKRKQCKTKLEAEKFASMEYQGSKKLGEEYFNATERERKEFSICLPKLREQGLSLTKAVEFALKRLRPEGGERTVAEITTEIIESKRIRFTRGDLRERSFKDFSDRAIRFADAFKDSPSHELTAGNLKEWLIGLEVTPRTTKNYLSIISEILKFAVQKKYIDLSPVDELTDSDRKELCGSGLNDKEPTILTIKQTSKLLETALEHLEIGLLGAITIGVFCGVRVEELKKLEWPDIKDSENDPIVTISGKIAKKRRIRHVNIPQNALKWLSLCTEKSGSLIDTAYYKDYPKRFNKLLKLAGFRRKVKGKWVSDWETNAMRHSFGTYHYALHRNPLETSRQLGHKSNDQVLFDHYRALATKEQGEAFFSIVPPKSESKLVEFVG